MERRLFYLINKAQSDLYKASDRESLKATGIPIVQNTALLALEKNDGCILSFLGKELGINKSSLGALADRMARNEIIEKRYDAEDGRTVRLFLTEKGRAALARLKPLIELQNKILMKGFDEDEIEVVLRFLNHTIEVSTESGA